MNLVLVTGGARCASTRSLNEIELKMKILYIAAVSSAINDSAFCFLLCWLLYLLLATNYYDCGPSDDLWLSSTISNHTAVQELQKIFLTSCCLKIIIISFNQIIWFIYLNKLCSICSVNFIINWYVISYLRPKMA